MKLTHNGRPFDANRFAVELEAKVIEAGIQSIEERALGVASAITIRRPGGTLSPAA
jgi:hypothetical protein